MDLKYQRDTKPELNSKPVTQNINNLVCINHYRIFPINKFNGIKCCLKIPCECKTNLFDHITYRLAVKVRIDGTPENPVNLEEKITQN